MGKGFDFAARISEIDTMLTPKRLVIALHSTQVDRLLTMMWDYG
jgi:hypothetical protein